MATSKRPPPGHITRRRFIKLAGGAVTVGVVGPYLPRAWADETGELSDVIRPCFDDSPVRAPFTELMPIPPIAPSQQQAGAQVVTLFERRGEHQFISGIPTPVWGYSPSPDGVVDPVPGPTILARKLRRTEVTFTNALPPNEERRSIILHPELDPTDEDHPFLSSSTVVHLHGINADMVSDGYPENRRQPGQTTVPPHLYPNNEYQRPATLWYHDHSVHITSLHVYRGLAGFYILTDDVEDGTTLPGTVTGEVATGRPGYRPQGDGFDIPLLIKDVMITPEERDGRPRGTLVYDNCSHMGAYGDVMTVNGKQQPRFPVGNRKYRFRTLNGSDARQYKVAFRRIENLRSGPDEEFFLIGTDHGLLAFSGALPTKFFHTTPSERWEFVFDFSRYPIGQRIVMVNLLADPDDRKLFPLMAFDVARVEPDSSTLGPTPLRPPEHPADGEPAAQRRFFLFDRQGGYFSINSKQWNPRRVDAFPVIDTNEEWTLETESGGWGHPVHIHLGRFRITEVQGRPPRPGELQGFKDTVWVGPNQRIRLIHQFWNFDGRYVFHCHNGSHEDHDMMSQFEVQPG